MNPLNSLIEPRIQQYVLLHCCFVGPLVAAISLQGAPKPLCLVEGLSSCEPAIPRTRPKSLNISLEVIRHSPQGSVGTESQIQGICECNRVPQQQVPVFIEGANVVQQEYELIEVRETAFRYHEIFVCAISICSSRNG